MTCFLLQDGRRHKINASLLSWGQKVLEFCGGGRECHTHIVVAGGHGQKFSGTNVTGLKSRPKIQGATYHLRAADVYPLGVCPVLNGEPERLADESLSGKLGLLVDGHLGVSMSGRHSDSV